MNTGLYPRTGLPPLRTHPLWPFRRQPPCGPASSLCYATPQRDACTGIASVRLRRHRAGSSNHLIESRSSPTDWFTPVWLLPTSSRDDAVTIGLQAGERMPGEDLHLSGWVRLEAHPVVALRAAWIESLAE